jgi:predicted permease
MISIPYSTLLGSELRGAVRAVWRRPGVYLACIGTLALGIGAAAAVFNWCNGILLNPYPAIRDSGQLVVLSSRTPAGATDTLSYPDFQAYRETASDLGDVVATAAAIQPLALTEDGTAESERVLGHAVSGNYFEALGIAIARGRGFRPEEDATRGAHAVAVISYGLWLRRFAADQAIVGKTIRLNREPFTVVGVVTQGFAGTLLGLTVDLWTTLTMQEQLRGVTLANRRDRWLIGLGRLQPGRTRETAEGQLQVIARRIEAADPIEDARQPALLPIWQSPWGAQGGMGRVLMILGAVAFLVLGLASLNAANLLLAHAVERQRQFSIQLAVGSKRWRLVAQLLMEGVFVAAVSSLLGLLVAIWAADLLTTLIPPADNTLTLNVPVDHRVVLFTLALLLPVSLLVSLAPLLHIGRSEVASLLRREGVGASRRARSFFRRSLIVAQVSLACLLVASTTLLVRSVREAQSTSPGFASEGILLSQYDLSLADGVGSAAQTHTAILNRLSALRLRAALASRVPLGFTPLPRERVEVPGYVAQPGEDVQVGATVVSEGYFDTMRVSFHAGRDFSTADDDRAPKVAIINAAMVQRFFSADPSGRSFRLGDDVLTVVGVVATVKQRTLNEEPLPHVYVPLLQHVRQAMILHVSAPAGTEAAVDAIRTAIRAEAPLLPPVNVTPIATHLRFATFAPRVTGIFLGAFGTVALFLASVALFGLMAYEVARRTSEIGLRLTVGASQIHIIALILGDAMKLTGVGVVVGIALAALSGRALQVLLVGVTPTDPRSLLIAAGVMFVVCMAACAWPLMRACRIDPATALRHL